MESRYVPRTNFYFPPFLYYPFVTTGDGVGLGRNTTVDPDHVVINTEEDRRPTRSLNRGPVEDPQNPFPCHYPYESLKKSSSVGEVPRH